MAMFPPPLLSDDHLKVVGSMMGGGMSASEEVCVCITTFCWLSRLPGEGTTAIQRAVASPILV